MGRESRPFSRNAHEEFSIWERVAKHFAPHLFRVTKCCFHNLLPKCGFRWVGDDMCILVARGKGLVHVEAESPSVMREGLFRRVIDKKCMFLACS